MRQDTSGDRDQSECGNSQCDKKLFHVLPNLIQKFEVARLDDQNIKIQVDDVMTVFMTGTIPLPWDRRFGLLETVESVGIGDFAGVVQW